MEGVGLEQFVEREPVALVAEIFVLVASTSSLKKSQKRKTTVDNIFPGVLSSQERSQLLQTMGGTLCH